MDKGISLGKRCERRTLSREEFEQSLRERHDVAMRAGNLRPSQLVYRNYWWQILEGPGIVEEVHEFDDGSGPDPEFDFLTVSLMGWNGFFQEPDGTPAPFPLYRAMCNVGEVPLSRRYWLTVGFLDPAWADGAPGKPWEAWIQIGFFGWKYA